MSVGRKSRLGGSALVGILQALILSNSLVAQVRPPQDSLRISVDFARFRGDEKTLYVEFYYSFSQGSITYVADSAGYEGGMHLDLLIQKGDSVAFAERWIVPHRLTSEPDSSRALELVSVSAAQLGEGNYSVLIAAHDRNRPLRTDTVHLSIPIRVMDTTRVVLSDLQLSTNIVQGSPGSPFYKNTLVVTPDAQGLFSNQQICYVYGELYNLHGGTVPEEYQVRTVVWDAARREIISRKKNRRRVGESAVVVDKITIASLHTGSYMVGIAVVDSSERVVTSSAKKFFVYNQALGVDTTLALAGKALKAGIYDQMNEGDLDREFEWARYLRGDDDVRKYSSLSGIDPKKAFLLEFWGRRPQGLRDEYLARVAFSNAQFRVLGREGYNTDRGRVYIVYGAADDYDRHPNEPGTRPYEQWRYDSIQGGVIFVFVQRVSGGQFELVHSTHRNELSDPLWFEHYAQTAR